MMPQPQQVPPFDAGNQLLGEQPAQFTTAKLPTPLGERLAVTIRTPSATVTVFLNGKDAKAWSAQFARDASAMSAAGLVVPGGVLPK